MTSVGHAVAGGARARVLVVDDNLDHRTLIRMRLRTAGWEVVEAGTGEEALERLSGVELVLCDYQLPGMNGVETLTEVRRRSQCSVVMVTGAGSESLVIEALRAGAVDYLVKDPTFLNSLPVVVERAWRQHDLEHRARELQRLSLLIASTNDRDEMLGGIVEGARRLLRADTCALYLQHDGRLIEDALAGKAIREPGLLLARVQAAHDQDADMAAAQWPTRHLLVPLRVDDVALGVLAVVTSSARTYLAEEQELAATFGAFAAIALANLNRSELQQELVERLQGLADLRRDLLASVSHELRTPLTCIIGFARTLEQRWTRLEDTDRQQFLEQIQRHGEELSDQVERLLDVASLESGRLSGNAHTLDLAEEIDAVVKLLQPLLEGRRVTVEAPSTQAVADSTLLRRALTNLLSNAAKYSPAGTDVAIRTSTNATTATISVVDRGVGLTREEAERAFEPFWRSRSAVESATRGAGVGLALAKEYARIMGGSVGVESQPGKGSTFSLTLPLSNAAAHRTT